MPLLCCGRKNRGIDDEDDGLPKVYRLKKTKKGNYSGVRWRSDPSGVKDVLDEETMSLHFPRDKALLEGYKFEHEYEEWLAVLRLKQQHNDIWMDAPPDVYLPFNIKNRYMLELVEESARMRKLRIPEDDDEEEKEDSSSDGSDDEEDENSGDEGEGVVIIKDLDEEEAGLPAIDTSMDFGHALGAVEGQEDVLGAVDEEEEEVDEDFIDEDEKEEEKKEDDTKRQSKKKIKKKSLQALEKKRKKKKKKKKKKVDDQANEEDGEGESEKKGKGDKKKKKKKEKLPTGTDGEN